MTHFVETVILGADGRRVADYRTSEQDAYKWAENFLRQHGEPGAWAGVRNRYGRVARAWEWGGRGPRMLERNPAARAWGRAD